MNDPLIVIVGETASGKSALAMEIASMYDCEIICADSRTIYRGMDIGTAKPTAADRRLVAHHMLDVITPDAQYTAALFKQQCNNAIRDILTRGKVPIIVGGTGLYVDSVLYDFEFSSKHDLALRTKLEQLSVDELQQMIRDKGIVMPTNYKNPRHLIRAIETGGTSSVRSNLRKNTLAMGLAIDRDVLHERIETRAEHMFVAGLRAEAEGLLGLYGSDAPGLQTIGYREFYEYPDGSDELIKQHIIKGTKAYAKRQRTWFGRNKSIQWISNNDDAKRLVQKFLSNTSASS